MRIVRPRLPLHGRRLPPSPDTTCSRRWRRTCLWECQSRRIPRRCPSRPCRSSPRRSPPGSNRGRGAPSRRRRSGLPCIGRSSWRPPTASGPQSTSSRPPRRWRGMRARRSSVGDASTSRSTSTSTSRIQIFSGRSRRRRCRNSSGRNPIPGPHHRTSRRRSNSPGSSRRRPSSRLLGRRHTSVSVSTGTSTSTSVRSLLEDMFPLQLAHMLLASRSTSTSLGSSTRGNLPRRRLAVHHYSKR